MKRINKPFEEVMKRLLKLTPEEVKKAKEKEKDDK